MSPFSEETMATRIFVYGTLLRGGPNAHYLGSSTFVCEALTVSPFYFISNETVQPPPPHDTYKYPYLMKTASTSDQTSSPVQGEVYEVDIPTLARLDILEGQPEHYLRQRIKVVAKDGAGGLLECDTYVLEHAPTMDKIRQALSSIESSADSSDCKSFKIIEGGDWRKFIGGYNS